MAKLGAYTLFVLASILAAGTFGALHDQISYTVSPEYFTHFKFLQFRLTDPSVPERVRAAQVGFLASWWMGVPLGLLAGLAGFAQKTVMQMRRALWWSIPLIVAFVLAFSLCGLLYGYFRTETIDLAAYAGWYIPTGVADLRRFLCAGYMHNSAYLGGVLAIPLAWVFHAIYRSRAQNAV